MLSKTKLLSGILALGLAVGSSVAVAKQHQKGDGTFSDKVINELNLNKEQQDAWNNARERMAQIRQEMKQTWKQESQKVQKVIGQQAQSSEPDLAKVQGARDEMRQSLQKFRQQRQEVTLSFFQQLTPEQKKIVLNNMQERMKKMKEKHRNNHSQNADDMMDEVSMY